MFHQAKLTDILIKEALLPLTFFQFSNSLCNIHLYIGSNIATTAAKLKMTPCKKDRWFNFTVKFISLTLSYPHTYPHIHIHKKCVSKRSVKHQVTLCAASCLSSIQASSMQMTGHGNYQSSTLLLGPFLGYWWNGDFGCASFSLLGGVSPFILSQLSQSPRFIDFL